MLEESEIDAISVPIQILAPENDFTYSQELKDYSNKFIPTLGVEYDYQYFILRMQHVTIQWYRGIRVGRRLLPSGRHERWKSRLTFGQMC